LVFRDEYGWHQRILDPSPITTQDLGTTKVSDHASSRTQRRQIGTNSLVRTCRRMREELVHSTWYFFAATEFSFTTIHKAGEFLASVPPAYRALITSLTLDVRDHITDDGRSWCFPFWNDNLRAYRSLGLLELGLGKPHRYGTEGVQGSFLLAHPHIERVVLNFEHVRRVRPLLENEVNDNWHIDLYLDTSVRAPQDVDTLIRVRSHDDTVRLLNLSRSADPERLVKSSRVHRDTKGRWRTARLIRSLLPWP